MGILPKESRAKVGNAASLGTFGFSVGEYIGTGKGSSGLPPSFMKEQERKLFA